MKARMEEFLKQYPVGCKVLLKPLSRRYKRQWGHAIVVEHLSDNRTVKIRCREEGTGHPAYILFGVRSEMKRACDVKDCWEPAVLVVEGVYYCGDHLPTNNSVLR